MEGQQPNRVDDPNIRIVLRLMMSNQDIECVLGDHGEMLDKLRQASRARISVSSGCSPDRVVTLAGFIDNVCTAFQYISENLHDFIASIKGANRNGTVSMKLIVPANYCGSIIGKAGAKIKEIRDNSGANVQVASNTLPESTERLLHILGTPSNASRAAYQLCTILIESADQIPKGQTIPFIPKIEKGNAVVLHQGQSFSLHNEFAVPAEERRTKLLTHPLADLVKLGIDPIRDSSITPATLVALGNTQVKSTQCNFNQNSGENNKFREAEIVVPKELMISVMGKSGVKLFEVKQLTGVQIEFSDSPSGPADILLTVLGPADMVSLAQYLINWTIELSRNQDKSETTDADIHNMISAYKASCEKNQRKSLESLTHIGDLLKRLVHPEAPERERVKTTGMYWRGQNRR